jgi:Uncharacterized ACR, COG1678
MVSVRIYFLLVLPILSESFSFIGWTRIFPAISQRLYSVKRLPAEDIRFLGKGPNALVREGVVLIAPQEEFHTFLRQAAVYIYAIGVDEYDETVVRGVILDHPTPFTMAEMSPGTVTGALSENLLWKGGMKGGDCAMMLHTVSSLGQDEIGTSGVFEGGLASAMETVENGEHQSDQFKFFFNYCQFTPTELDDMLSGVDDDGDAWVSVEVPSGIVFADWNRGDCWRYLRNVIRQRFENAKSAATDATI